MLINLCENYLETEVKCDQPSTDGYDIRNLLTNTNSEFLAYSTINPPINIDFYFICNIKLSHVLIWPRVGSQKSTGFKISTKFNRHHHHNLLSSGFLNTNHTGILFSTKNVSKNDITMPPSFFNASISNYHDKYIDCLDNLRITIVKTDKSVPAISKIEIWGYISSLNKSENINKFHNLLSKQTNFIHQVTMPIIKHSNDDLIINNIPIKSSPTLEIPEEYLDPITWTIMLQPIILPCGKVIDQSTLENYGENEALWGRPLSDPFTGITLNNNYKPIFAIQLKLKIDKFLSDNSDDLEIKKLPRTLGHKNNSNFPLNCVRDHKNIVSNQSTKEISIKTTINQLHQSKINMRHKLPIVSRQRSHTIIPHNINKISRIPSITTNTTVLQLQNNETTLGINCKIDDKLKNNLQKVLSNLKRFSDIKNNEVTNINVTENICNCCEFPIYYKLPCNHIVCRKIILSHSNNINNNNNNNMNSQCPKCHFNYKSSEIIKFNN